MSKPLTKKEIKALKPTLPFYKWKREQPASSTGEDNSAELKKKWKSSKETQQKYKDEYKAQMKIYEEKMKAMGLLEPAKEKKPRVVVTAALDVAPIMIKKIIQQDPEILKLDTEALAAASYATESFVGWLSQCSLHSAHGQHKRKTIKEEDIVSAITTRDELAFLRVLDQKSRKKPKLQSPKKDEATETDELYTSASATSTSMSSSTEIAPASPPTPPEEAPAV